MEKQTLLDAGLCVVGKKGSLYDKFRNRLMMPVISAQGEVLGFTSRIIGEGTPKYLNTPETEVFKKRSILYGIHRAKNTRQTSFLLVEGNLDVITLHQAGFDNAVATMGTALTEEHIRFFSKYGKELILCYDNDAAGMDATQRALGLLKNASFPVRVLELPRRITEEGEAVKQDADDFIKNQGAAAFQNLLSRRSEGQEYRLEKLMAQYDLNRDEQRIAFLSEAAQLLCTLSPVERDVYGHRAAQAAKVSWETMEDQIKREGEKKARSQRRQEERQAMSPALYQPAERSLQHRYLRAALAEEGLIRLLLLDNTLIGDTMEINSSYFSSPLLGKVYTLMVQWWDKGNVINLPAFSGELSGEEMSYLVQISQKPESSDRAREALADYLQVITGEWVKRNNSVEEALLSLREQKRKRNKEGKV